VIFILHLTAFIHDNEMDDAFETRVAAKLDLPRRSGGEAASAPPQVVKSP
jgi:hypothetical protein